MPGVPLPAPPSLRLQEVKDATTREAFAAIHRYLDALKQQIERDYVSNVQPACRAFHNTTQTWGATTPFAPAMNSERYDTDTIHDTVTSNSRLTARTAGKYHVTLDIVVTTSATFNGNILDFQIRLNGGATLVAEARAIGVGVSQTQKFSISGDWDLAVSDYVEPLIDDNNTDAGSNTVNAVEFSMFRVGG